MRGEAARAATRGEAARSTPAVGGARASHDADTRGPSRWVRGVRARFVLILLLGVILPNSLLAVWIGRSARTSALALLEAQLHETLASAARTIGHRWVELRSPLLDLADYARVRAALKDEDVPAAPLVLDDEAVWRALGGVAERIAILDTQERVRVVMQRPAGAREAAGSSPGLLPVRLPVFDGDGVRTGTLEAGVPLATLLPPLYGWGAAAGSVPAILASDGTPLVQVAMEPLLHEQRRFTWDGEDWLAAHRDVHDPPLRLVLAAPTAPHTEPFTAAARRGVLALLLVLAFSVLLITVLSRQVSAPIRRLTLAAERVAGGRLDDDALAEGGPDEIRRLGRAFNSMTASLRRLIRRVSQQQSAAAVGEFAASLAHEVRNPLTSVRLDLERARERIDQPGAADALLERALRQVERLDATVAGALRIARSGSLDLTPLDLREPVAAALRTAAALFAGRDVRLAPWTPPAEPLTVRGNAAAIEQMLLNLLMNAADAVEGGGGGDGGGGRDAGEGGGRGDRRGGRGEGGGRGGNGGRGEEGRCVAVETEVHDGAVRIRVRDDGRGMSPEELERALEAFFTTRQEGTGLGLTVVQRIAGAHGAELEIDSGPGRGTSVTVILPQSTTPRW